MELVDVTRKSAHGGALSQQLYDYRDGLLLFCGCCFAVFYGRLEILDAFTETFAEVGKFRRSKDEQSDSKDHQQLRDTNFSTEHKVLQIKPAGAAGLTVAQGAM
jgi:hypothetical protein